MQTRFVVSPLPCPGHCSLLLRRSPWASILILRKWTPIRAYVRRAEAEAIACDLPPVLSATLI